MNLYGQDMDETVSPLDAGLAWTVAMKDGRDFVGKSALTANGQQKQFLGLILLDKGVLRGHQQVITKQGNGEITSGSFSPTLQQSIALARLPLGVQIGDEVKSISAASYSKPRSPNPYSPATAKQSSNSPHSGENHVQRPRQPQVRQPPTNGFCLEADGSVTVGITDHAQEALGDLVFRRTAGSRRPF
jgi:hypothetical protein